MSSVTVAGGSGASKGLSKADQALAAELAKAKTPADAKATLKKIAKKCEARVNRRMQRQGKSLPLTGRDCTRAGTEKHKCCEKMVRSAGNPPVQAEVPLDSNGNDISSSYNRARRMAYGACKKARQQGRDTKGLWGKVFFSNCKMYLKPDVIFTAANGEKWGMDFKFPCGKNAVKMDQDQQDKYDKLFPAPGGNGSNVAIISAR